MHRTTSTVTGSNAGVKFTTCVIASALLAAGANAQAQAWSPPLAVADYISVAEQQLQLQADLLTGSPTSDLTAFFPNVTLRDEMLVQRDALVALGKKLDAVGAGISAASVDLSNCSLAPSGTGVDLLCSKTTSLSFGGGSSAMGSAEYVVQTTVSFSNDSNPRLLALKSASADAQQLLPTDSYPSKTRGAVVTSRVKSRLAATTTTPATFVGLPTAQKLLAVSYAIQYALSPNPAYIQYPNDCTNFVSQSMRAAGWTFTGNGSYAQMADARYWNYYGGIYPATSYTPYAWRVADYLYNFATGDSGRGLIIGQYGPANAKANQTALFPGDLVFYAIGAGGTTEPMNHVAIITNRADGIVKLSQHSDNHLNNIFANWVDRAVVEANKTNEPVTFYFVRT